jgi:hypothetical protein
MDCYQKSYDIVISINDVSRFYKLLSKYFNSVDEYTLTLWTGVEDDLYMKLKFTVSSEDKITSLKFKELLGDEDEDEWWDVNYIIANFN